MRGNGNNNNGLTSKPAMQQQSFLRPFQCLTVLSRRLEDILSRDRSLLLSSVSSAWDIQRLIGWNHAAILVFVAHAPCYCAQVQ